MRAFGVVGTGADRLGRRLAATLGDEGRVAVVRGTEESFDTPGEGVTECRVGESGVTTVGRDRDLDGVLDDLTREHDFAIVLDASGADLPQVVVGDGAYDGSILARVADPDAADVAELRDEVAAVEPRETLESLVAAVERTAEADRAGAIATFTGRVRTRDEPDDVPTESLEFETYDDVADDRMDAIREELAARDGVRAVRLHHRTGVVEAGEHVVFVVVLAGHREEAFTAVEDGIDRLKAEVPIFKREVTAEESFWVHDRP